MLKRIATLIRKDDNIQLKSQFEGQLNQVFRKSRSLAEINYPLVIVNAHKINYIIVKSLPSLTSLHIYSFINFEDYLEKV